MASSNGSSRPISVGVVGAGFGGVGMGIRLRQEGIEDFEIFERGETVGGVWRANTYPGAACDVPSHLYSFSFAPGHNWSRRYAPQPEILDYMEEITDRFGMRSHLRLGTEVTAATFDEESGRWTVTTDGGESPRVRRAGHGLRAADPAAGAARRGNRGLRGPRLPLGRVGPLARSGGPQGRGDRHWRLRDPVRARDREGGRRSSRSTSARRPGSCRRPTASIPQWERRIFERFPARVAAARAGFFAFFEAGTYGFTGTNWVLRPFRKVADTYRESELPDPELARPGDARLRDRLQAGPVHQRLVLDAEPRATSSC